MNVLVIAEADISVAIVVAAVMTGRRLFENERLYDVAQALVRCVAADHALQAARLSRADESEANAMVAAAEEALKRAEARLPRRSKNTRAYFASKEKA